MHTSHHPGGAPDVFLSNASDVTRRYLHRLEQAHTLLADAAPRLAMRLVELGLDPKVKAYAQISAISEAFKVLQQGVIDKEAQDQIRAIKETLGQLEGGAPDVIDV